MKLPNIKQEDLNLYLKMIERQTALNKVNVKHQGATDMSGKLESYAIYAMNRTHNPNNNYYQKYI